MKDVSAGEAERPLEIERRDHLARDDGGFEAGRERGDGPRGGVAEAFTLRVPRRSAQAIGRELHVGRHDVRLP